MNKNHKQKKKRNTYTVKNNATASKVGTNLVNFMVYLSTLQVNTLSKKNERFMVDTKGRIIEY